MYKNIIKDSKAIYQTFPRLKEICKSAECLKDLIK